MQDLWNYGPDSEWWQPQKSEKLKSVTQQFRLLFVLKRRQFRGKKLKLKNLIEQLRRSDKEIWVKLQRKAFCKLNLAGQETKTYINWEALNQIGQREEAWNARNLQVQRLINQKASIYGKV